MEQSCTGASMDTCGEGVNIGRAGGTPHGGKGGLGHVCLQQPDELINGHPRLLDNAGERSPL
jgi:hypothetical protein